MRHSFFLVLALCWACQNQPSNTANVPAQPEQTAAGDAAIPADFNAFYEQFHRDSLYQMAHIVWPLQGDERIEVDSMYQIKPKYWEAATWRMHRSNFDAKDYRVERQAIGDVMVVERILTKLGNYGIERRFAKQPDGEWNMIFYSDIRER